MWPVETVSNSEGGFERIYQETSLLNHWQLNIPALKKTKIKLAWSVDILSNNI